MSTFVISDKVKKLMNEIINSHSPKYNVKYLNKLVIPYNKDSSC